MLNLLFMKIFTGIALACFAFCILYALICRRGGKVSISQKLTALAFAITSLIFISLVIAHAILLFTNIYPNLPFIFSTSVDLSLQVIGTTLIFLFMVLGIWGVLSLREFTADIRLTEGHKIVRTGAYRWVRHPLYAALIYWCVGNFLFFKSPFFLILFALIPVAYLEAKREEKLLMEAFGEEYKKYRNVTGMFFPKFLRRN